MKSTSKLMVVGRKARKVIIKLKKKMIYFLFVKVEFKQDAQCVKQLELYIE